MLACVDAPLKIYALLASVNLHTTHLILGKNTDYSHMLSFQIHTVSDPFPLKYSYCSQLTSCYILLLPKRFNSQNFK